ncbi:interleukin-6 receptor subunit alpha-like [Heptranchias perlo]|uniref:interleukin-6 receptor subunit alpha-like n=1 Tax=Heptranchias perlo TaxID=212740 RepID=UPI00355A9891
MGIGAAWDVLAAIALLTCCSAAGKNVCPQTAITSGIQMARIGAQVNIDCGPGGTNGPSTAEWKFNGRLLSSTHRYTINNTKLIFNPVQSKDTGNYVCLRNGTKAVSVRLLVGDVPRTPTLSCYLKSYLTPIRCEWPSKELNRMTKCILSFRTSLQHNSTLKPCKFFTGKKVCVCMMPHGEAEYEHYFISLTVSNGIGCRSSKEKMFTFDDLLKPDPPILVKVKPIQKAAHKLNVTWSYPQNWQRDFYFLQFQVIYSVQQELAFKEVTIKETKFLISDALPEKNYTVQVRAREEFNHGSWSEWSEKAFGVPWEDPKRNKVPEEETEGYPSTLIESEDHDFNEEIPQGSYLPEWPAFPRYGPWLVGASLITMTALFIIIVIRYRKKWKAKGKGKEQNRPEYLLIAASEPRQPAKESAPTAETPLQQTPDLTSIFLEERTHFDVLNVGYFYIAQ